MSSAGYTPEDLALFRDLEPAADGAGLTPYLIGAGALQLGAALEWGFRLSRRTRDWDFAVRVESWPAYRALADALVRSGKFQRAQEPHRFRHREGGTLDLLPFGALEHPEGTITWTGGVEMDTNGLAVLDEQHQDLQLDRTRLRVASLPAIVGLKLLAYRSRRTTTTHDIDDVHTILRGVEASVSDERIAADGLERLGSEDVTLNEIGAYLLGRDVGRAFASPDLELMLTLLQELDSPRSRIVSDVRSPIGEFVAPRFRALRLGLIDR